MFIPGFDPASMTDDELLNKETDLQGRVVAAANYSNMYAVDQLQYMLTLVKNEQIERLSRKTFEMQKKGSPDVYEVDPDMRAKQQQVETQSKEEASPKKKSLRPERKTVLRSSRPTRPSND